jgi:5'-nucleotidase
MPAEGRESVMNILVTNDDGVHAPGIVALAEALRAFGHVTVVAPDRERSAVGHALTLHHPLRVTEIMAGIFAVDGTPTDCVNLGIHTLLTETPDIVVSGVNRGGNLGDDITYSGTVSAALEATLMGIPAIAVSLVTGGHGSHYHAAAAFAARLAGEVVERGLPRDTFLNVNVPDLPSEELCGPVITSQGKRDYGGDIVAKVDPRGRSYYWIGGSEPVFRDIEGTDFHAVKRRRISVTPLHLDLTNYASLSILQSWDLS